jgi:hypothetical protein
MTFACIPKSFCRMRHVGTHCANWAVETRPRKQSFAFRRSRRSRTSSQFEEFRRGLVSRIPECDATLDLDWRDVFLCCDQAAVCAD